MIVSPTTGRRKAPALGLTLAALTLAACDEKAPTDGTQRAAIEIAVTDGDVKPGMPFTIRVTSGLLDSLATVTVAGSTASATLSDGSTILTVMPSGSAGRVTVQVAGWSGDESVGGTTTATRTASALTTDAATYIATTFSELDSTIAALDAAPAPAGVDPATFAAQNAQVAQLSADVQAQVAGLSATDRAALAEFLATIDAEARSDSIAQWPAVAAALMSSEGGCNSIWDAINCVRRAKETLEGQRFWKYRFHVVATALVVGGVLTANPVLLAAGGLFVLKSLSAQQQWASQAAEAVTSASITIGAELGAATGSNLRALQESSHQPPFVIAPVGQAVAFPITRISRSPTSGDTDVADVARVMDLIDEHNNYLDQWLQWIGIELPVRLPQLPDVATTTRRELVTAAELDIWAISQNAMGATASIADDMGGTTLTIGGAPPQIGERIFLEMNVGLPESKQVPLQAAVYVTVATDCPTTMSAAGGSYPVVAIGGQCWMAENLGGAVGDLATTSLAWADPYQLNHRWGTNPKYTYAWGLSETVARYGYLYNWYAAQSACPAGWRLPTREDVARLVASGEASGHGVYALMAMDESSGAWDTGLSTNALGFGARPSGHLAYGGVTWDIDLQQWVESTPLGFENALHHLWTSEHEELEELNRVNEPVPYVMAWMANLPGGSAQSVRANAGAAVRCVRS